MKNEDYRPKNITFDVAMDETVMPEALGEFKKHEDVLKFLGNAKLTTINQAMTASRHMDATEKKEIRENYIDVLENVLPRLEKDHSVKTQAFNEAKKAEKDAHEMVNASISEAKILARDAKRGLKPITLDDVYTFRLPYKGRYYFYTWIDGVLKLCKISDIPEHEKTEIWNAMAANEEFIEKTFPDENGEVKT